MSDLISLVLLLRPLEIPADRADFPAWWGRASQAALLDVVRQANPTLAEALHQDSELRPYTASTLMGPLNHANNAPQTGERYWLRWTALTPELSAILLQFAQRAPGSVLELDRLPFQVESAHVNDDHPWAGQTAYNALASLLLPGAAISRQVTLRFTSPVVFKSGGLSHPLPTASLVFNSLIEKWNAFAPVALMPELRRYAEECLAVSRFHLKSRPVPLKEGGLRIGAVGQVTFAATNYDRFWLGQIHTLAAFALFAGVGAGTTQGLGQVRIADAPRQPD